MSHTQITETTVTTKSWFVYLRGRVDHWLDKPYDLTLPRAAILALLLVYLAPMAPWRWLYVTMSVVGMVLIMRAPSWADQDRVTRLYRTMILAFICAATVIASALLFNWMS